MNYSLIDNCIITNIILFSSFIYLSLSYNYYFIAFGIVLNFSVNYGFNQLCWCLCSSDLNIAVNSNFEIMLLFICYSYAFFDFSCIIMHNYYCIIVID